MKRPKLKFILCSGVLVLLAAVCLIFYAARANALQSQKQAERWAGESGQRFAQISCFLAQSERMEREQVYTVRQALTEKLAAQSLESEEGAELFCDAWSASGTVKVTGARGTFDAEALAVGGKFFEFHPMVLRDGGFLSERDVMKDRVVIDEQLAWLLYGSTELAGLTVSIGGSDYIIAGVVARENDPATRKVCEGGPLLFLPYEAAADAGIGGIDCYEAVLPDQVDGFAMEILTAALPLTDSETVQNTGRFAVPEMLRALRSFGMRSVRTSAVAFPFWENAARCTESWCMLLLAAAMLFLLLPALWVCVTLVRLLLLGRKKLRTALPALAEKAADKMDERRTVLRSRGGSHVKRKG